MAESGDARELFDRHAAVVYRRARRLLGSHHDAEEAVQDVFLRVLSSYERFEHRSSITTWLYQVTTNLCLNRLRDRNRRDQLWQEQGSASPVVSTPPADPDQLALVRELLAGVDESAAAAAVYVHIDGMTHEEAVELLGVSRRTVGNLLARFREAIDAREPAALPESGLRRVEEP